MKLKNFFLKLLTLGVMFVLTLIMACACSIINGNSGNSGGNGGGGNNPVPTITLSLTDKTLDINESFTLTATLENVSGTVTWASSDSAVASVDQNGLVKAKSEGNATITATIQEVSATCAIIVENSHNLPYAVLTAEDVEIVNPNQEITVQVSTMLNGNPVDGLTYEWATDVDGIVELTPSTDTASVNIKGVKFGTVNVSCLTVCYGVPLFPSFTVTVFNPNVTFEVENSMEGVDGYPVNLTLFDGAQYDNEYTLSDITVKDGEQVIDNSQIQWIVNDESVASFENGVIKAKNIGQTKILALYNNNGVYFNINVVKAEFTVKDFMYIEVAEDNGFVRGDNVKGSVESVVYNTYDFFKEESDGRIHLDEKAIEIIGLGKVIDPIVVVTDQATYSYQNVEFIAMLIDNKEEFDRMDEVALSLGDGDTSTPTMDGIFYLNADIAYNGVYTPNEMNVANDSLGGFVGTFDGRGHVISGLKIVDGGYIFASIKNEATFKNVTFLNSEYDGTTMQSGTGAFLSKIVDGELKNVFIHLAKVTLKDRNAMLVAQVNHGGAKAYQNVIVAIDQVVKASGATRNPVLQTFGSRSWSAGYNNVIGIAPKVAGVDITMLSTCENDGKGNAINWRTYANSYTALTKMNEDFENGNWDEDFWHEVSGVVLPKSVVLGTTTQTYEVGNNTAGIQNWVEYKRNVEGVTGYTYKSNYTYNPNMVLDLSAYNFSDVLSTTIGGVECSSSFNAGMLTIDKNTVTARGDTSLVIVGVVDGKALSVIQPLLLADILISTADDFEAMQWLADPYAADDQNYRQPSGIYNVKMAGYIVLTNNIAYNRTYRVHHRSLSWTTDGNSGFLGTLDGRGFAVDGLEMVEQIYATNTYPTNLGGFTTAAGWSAGSGIFAELGKNASIKNIAFTNAKHSCGGGFITTAMWGGNWSVGNAIENVYIHLLSAQGSAINGNGYLSASGVFCARFHGGGVTIKNCFVKIDAVSNTYYNFGSFTSGSIMTASNVYICSPSTKLVYNKDTSKEVATHVGVTVYANAEAATNDKAAWAAKLTSSVWNTSGDLPVFANA